MMRFPQNPTPEQVATLPEKEREFVLAALDAGVADRRNTRVYVQRAIARARWIRANAAESERRRRAALEARPQRLALLKRATLKRRRKASQRLQNLAVRISCEN